MSRTLQTFRSQNNRETSVIPFIIHLFSYSVIELAVHPSIHHCINMAMATAGSFQHSFIPSTFRSQQNTENISNVLQMIQFTAIYGLCTPNKRLLVQLSNFWKPPLLFSNSSDNQKQKKERERGTEDNAWESLEPRSIPSYIRRVNQVKMISKTMRIAGDH